MHPKAARTKPNPKQMASLTPLLILTWPSSSHIVHHISKAIIVVTWQTFAYKYDIIESDDYHYIMYIDATMYRCRTTAD